MADVEIQSEFEKLYSECVALRRLFPNMAHFLAKWPIGGPVPIIHNCPAFNTAKRDGNICLSLEYQSNYYSGCMVRHWLIRSFGEHWQIDIATRKLKEIAERAICSINKLSDLIVIETFGVDKKVLDCSNKKYRVEKWLSFTRVFQKPTSVNAFCFDDEPIKFADESEKKRFYEQVFKKPSPINYLEEPIIFGDRRIEVTMVPDIFDASIVLLYELLKKLRGAEDKVIVQEAAKTGTGQEDSDKPGDATKESIPIDDMELTILTELAEGTDKTFSQVEIEAATSIKRGTLKDKLLRLERIDLIHRPLGKRKGYQITDKGRQIVQRNQ